MKVHLKKCGRNVDLFQYCSNCPRVQTYVSKNECCGCQTFRSGFHVFKKSKTFVKRWVERYKVTKTVDDLLERGKKRFRLSDSSNDTEKNRHFRRGPSNVLSCKKKKLQ